MADHCPICATSLTRIRVAPCFDCGHSSAELDELANDEHDYHVFRLWGLELVLCDFCDADFGSYYPDYWGLPGGFPMDYPLELVGKVEQPVAGEDGYCPQCKHRLAFLDFRAAVLAQRRSRLSGARTRTSDD